MQEMERETEEQREYIHFTYQENLNQKFKTLTKCGDFYGSESANTAITMKELILNFIGIITNLILLNICMITFNKKTET